MHRHFQFRLILVRPTLHILGPICSEGLYLSLLSRTLSERPVSSPSQRYTPGPSPLSAISISIYHCCPGVPHHSTYPALFSTHTPHPLHLAASCSASARRALPPPSSRPLRSSRVARVPPRIWSHSFHWRVFVPCLLYKKHGRQELFGTPRVIVKRRA